MALTVSLEHKTAIVTGASSGIGAAVAEAMAVADARVVLVGRDRGRLEDVHARIEAAGGEAHVLARDITEDDAPQRIVAETVDVYGGIDCLVLGAGIFTPAPVDVSLELLDSQWRTNVRAPFALTVAALPELRARKGSIVYLSSIAGKVGFPSSSAYCATKGAIEMLTRSLAVEEAPNGVRVNAIAPGNVETRMNAHLMEDPDYLRAMLDATPMGRNGQAAEMAPMVVLLASEASTYTTGASVLVDGGWAAQ